MDPYALVPFSNFGCILLVKSGSERVEGYQVVGSLGLLRREVLGAVLRCKSPVPRKQKDVQKSQRLDLGC